MINLLLGAPGGGKSYEAVVYHVLPALKSGRKVITNLPLNLEVFKAIDENYISLIEVRNKSLAVPTEIKPSSSSKTFEGALTSMFTGSSVVLSVNSYPFSNPCDYSDKWRHPDTGAGPLYVIDECHIALPYSGTILEVEHWYSLHRHESADVLLITQSYSKINKAIRDLVQVVYQVRKNTAIGSQSSYTRKVRDGIRGEVVNSSVRQYQKRYFKYYQSYTRGGGSELAANDIIPIWKHWTFKASALFFALFAYLVFSGNFKMPFLADSSPVELIPAASASFLPVPNPDPVSLADVEPLPPEPEIQGFKHPFDGLNIHILGSISSKAKGLLYLIGLSQNGQIVQQFSQYELIAAGYRFTAVSGCVAKIQYEDFYNDFIRCDRPQTSGGIGSDSA
ncbi:MAG: hypothetical protein GQ532_06055 [Methylomarinum sp.]|nr:hypothetical protein [Methylomarinum sp.]